MNFDHQSNGVETVVTIAEVFASHRFLIGNAYCRHRKIYNSYNYFFVSVQYTWFTCLRRSSSYRLQCLSTCFDKSNKYRIGLLMHLLPKQKLKYVVSINQSYFICQHEALQLKLYHAVNYYLFRFQCVNKETV